MRTPLERNRDLIKVKSRTAPQILAPRWKIWVTNLLSLTIFLLISFKSLASYLILGVLPSPEFTLALWKFPLLYSSSFGVSQTAPSVASPRYQWSLVLLKNEMIILLITPSSRQFANNPRFVMITPLWFKNLEIQSLPFVKVYNCLSFDLVFSMLNQNYQLSNTLTFYPFSVGVLGDEFLELLITRRWHMENGKEKIDTNEMLLFNHPKRYMSNSNNECAGKIDKSNSSMSLPNPNPPSGGSTNNIKIKRGGGSNPCNHLYIIWIKKVVMVHSGNKVLLDGSYVLSYGVLGICAWRTRVILYAGNFENLKKWKWVNSTNDEWILYSQIFLPNSLGPIFTRFKVENNNSTHSGTSRIKNKSIKWKRCNFQDVPKELE